MAEENAASVERIQRYNKLKSDRSNFDTLAQTIADYILPVRSQITTKKTPDVSGYVDNIHNDTAIDANEVLASGLISNTTPPTERWAAYEAPWGLKARNDGQPVAEKWYQQVSEATMAILAASNFYAELYPFHLERNIFPAGCLYVEEGKESPLNFKAIAYGTYVISRNEEGKVDTVMREFELTARQAVQKFGIENLGERVRDAYNNPKNKDKKFCFLHSVYPSEEANGVGEYTKPFKSCYDSIEDKQQVAEGGYDEMPYIVARFTVWPGEIWGFSPGIISLPTVRQVNEMEDNMDALGEIAAFPRVLAPSNMVGTIEMGANGITYMDESAGQFGQPREWLTGGRYDVGKDRTEMKNDAIRKHFHNDLFQMLANIESGRLTAYEVMQRVSEKLEVFAPAFQRITVEFLDPLMNRVFGILYRGGYFPEAPPDVMEVTGADADGLPVMELVRPKVTFQSKMALALKSIENKGFIEWLQIFAPLIPTNPEVLDRINLDRQAEKIARNLGSGSDTIRTDEEVAQIREERAQQQQAAMAMQAAQVGAKAVSDVSKSPQAAAAMGL